MIRIMIHDDGRALHDVSLASRAAGLPAGGGRRDGRPAVVVVEKSEIHLFQKRNHINIDDVVENISGTGILTTLRQKLLVSQLTFVIDS